MLHDKIFGMDLSRLEICWDSRKNEKLKLERSIGFEDVVMAIEEGRILSVLKNPKQDKYPNQRILIIEIGNYAYVVPFEIRKDVIWLITVYPSRKYTKIYLRGEYEEEKD